MTDTQEQYDIKIKKQMDVIRRMKENDEWFLDDKKAEWDHKIIN